MTNKLTATTISLPFYYNKGVMEIDQENAKKMINQAYTYGVRNFTTSPQYVGGECEAFLGEVLKNERENIKLSTNFPYFDVTLPEENPFDFCLDRSLGRLQTDYLDCLYLYADCVDAGLLQEQLVFARKSKKERKTNHIGMIFNPHNLQNAKEVMEIAKDIVDTIMIYFIPTMPHQIELLKDLKAQGITIVAGGLVDVGSDILPDELLNATANIKACSATELASRYFLSQDLFDQVIFQLKDEEFLNTVRNAQMLIDKQDIQDTYDIEKYFKQTQFNPANPRIICCSCGYCTPCPSEIEIPKIFNTYAYYDQYGMKDIAIQILKNHQANLNGSIVDACSDCGLCEKRCSHSTPIRENLKAIEKFINNF